MKAMVKKLNTDKKRQATGAIRGYAYQAYQSILAWTRLGPDEVLFLEGAEDFDVYTPSEVQTVQVKSTQTAKRITLQSRDAVKALNHFWEHQKNNPQHKVRFRFLTTAQPGKEKEGNFGAGELGITYWKKCKKDKNLNVEPIRWLLKRARCSQPLKDFLNTASDAEIQEQLIEPFDWDTGMLPVDAVEEAINSRLIFQGDAHGINSHTSKKVLDALLREIICLLSSDKNREISYADFVTFFEKQTMDLVPRKEAAEIKSLGQISQNTRLLDIANASPILEQPLPLVKGAARRTTLVEELRKILTQNGLLILRGSTGLGKTSLAGLVTDAIGGEWMGAGFRGKEGEQIANHLRRAAYEIQVHDLPDQIVLDDLDMDSIHLFEREFLSLAFSLIDAGGRLLVTTQGTCPADMLSKLWAPMECEQEIPYLEEMDVAELLISHGLTNTKKIQKWVTPIRLTTFGHPQLVHARVRNLQTRKWPKPRVSDIVKEPADVEKVKRLARKRLLEDFPSDEAKVLAFRLSLIASSFSRQIAIDLGGMEPSIPMPGAAFDYLEGPWIELIGEDRFRISPLLANAGKKTLSKSEQLSAHKQIVISLLQSSMAPSDIGTAFAHAIHAEDDSLIVFISGSVMTAGPEITQAISDSVPWLSKMGMRPLKKITSSDAAEITLRLAQYKVAEAGKDYDSALRIINYVLRLVKKITPQEVRESIEAIAYSTFLMSLHVPIPPKKSIGMLVRLIKMADNDDFLSNLAESFKSATPLSDNFADFSPFQILFAFETVRISGVKAFDELLKAINALEKGIQEQLIAVLENSRDDTAYRLAGNAWWRDTSEDRLDTKSAISVYRNAIQLAAKWNSPSLEKASYIAISVLHDEYENNSSAAFDVLDEAVSKFSHGDTHLLNQRAKVHFNQKDYDSAVQIYCDVLNRDDLDNTERAFAGRRGGMSAGNLDRWDVAESLFQKGASAADSMSSKDLATGLWADMAFAQWKQDKKKESLQQFANVLTRLEDIPQDRDIQSRHVHATVRHVLGWIHESAHRKQKDKPSRAEPSPGCCSVQTPHEKIWNKELIDLNAVWGLLGVIDARLETGLQIARTAKKKYQGKPPVIIQSLERMELYRNFFRKPDPNNAVRDSIHIMEVIEASSNQSGDETGDVAVWRSANIKPLTKTSWDNSKHKGLFFHLLIAIGTIVLSSSPSARIPVEKWKSDALKAKASGDDVERFFDLLTGTTQESKEKNEEECAKALFILGTDLPAPPDLLTSHYRLLENLLKSADSHKDDVAAALMKLVVRQWIAASEQQRFLFRTPAVDVSAIQNACWDKGKNDFPRVARVLLTASRALPGMPLGDSVIQFLKEIEQS